MSASKKWKEVNEALVLSNLRARDEIEGIRQDEEQRQLREQQHAVVAELGQRALSGIDVRQLMDDAVIAVAETLGVENTKILELLSSGDELLLRAGLGWKEGYVGHATVSTGSDSQAGYTLLSREAVVVDDLATETRFSGPALLTEHGIVSGVSVIIPGRDRPFGVMGAHTTSQRQFNRDDVHFLQSIANVLAAAIERKGMEEELQASRDELKAILEGVADGITVQDTTGRLVFANDAAARIIGFDSAEDLLGATSAEILDRFELKDEQGHPFPPSELPGRKAMQGQGASERILRFRDMATGEERWSSVKARPMLDPSGRPRMAINVFRDVTARRRDQEAQRFLADATALLASSLDYETTLARVAQLAVPHIADWCAVHLMGDRERLRSLVVVHVDPAKAELVREYELHYTPDEESSSGVLNVIRTGEAELYPELSDSMLVERARSEEHLRIMREVGIRSVMIVPMTARGRTLGAITLVQADSGRRYGSDDLALAKHLGRRAALAVDNARLYREAQDAIRVRNELFSSVSHDLKNPLTGIKGMAQLLRRQLARVEIPGRERVLEGLASIDTTATRMTAQIDELLDLARLQSGQQLTLSRRLTDLVTLVREVALEEQRRTERHVITVEAEPQELIGDWDAVRLTRVVINLLSNAVKYSPEGGTIRLSTAGEFRDGRPWAVLSVEDEGVGIPANELPMVFEGFHRGENVASQIAGTGLGLTSARQIVELHGGTIEVSSEEGAGSTFTVRLPLRVEEENRALDSEGNASG